MEQKYSVYGNSLVIHLGSELDHHCSETIREDIEKYMRYCQIKNIIFDFKKTAFMDSSGIGLIMGRYKLMGVKGGNVYAVEICEAVRKIFNMSGLHKIIRIYDSLDDLMVVHGM